MRTIKSLKDVTTLEVGDKVVFGDLEYVVNYFRNIYYIGCIDNRGNNTIFKILKVDPIQFIQDLGIEIVNEPNSRDFPEVRSLEALTAIVSALFKEYEKQNELPKTWEEFCEKNPIKKEESWIKCFDGKIMADATRIEGTCRDTQMDKNMCTSKREAQAFLALMQLRQLRKAYVKDWEPDFKQACYGIVSGNRGIAIITIHVINRNLSFPTYELAKQFYDNFKDLLETAKVLF